MTWRERRRKTTLTKLSFRRSKKSSGTTAETCRTTSLRWLRPSICIKRISESRLRELTRRFNKPSPASLRLKINVICFWASTRTLKNLSTKSLSRRKTLTLICVRPGTRNLIQRPMKSKFTKYPKAWILSRRGFRMASTRTRRWPISFWGNCHSFCRMKLLRLSTSLSMQSATDSS